MNEWKIEISEKFNFIHKLDEIRLWYQEFVSFSRTANGSKLINIS